MKVKECFTLLHYKLHSEKKRLIQFTKTKLEWPIIKCLVIIVNARSFRALRKLSDEERVWALDPIEAGIYPHAVADQLNIHPSTIFWCYSRHPALDFHEDMHLSNCGKATFCGWDQFGENVETPTRTRYTSHLGTDSKEFEFPASDTEKTTRLEGPSV